MKIFYVYMLRSLNRPEQTYVGFTRDIRQRLNDHNNGKSPHTSKYMPWRLVTYLGFSEKDRAKEFEFYLKSHSGKAFASKRLW